MSLKKQYLKSKPLCKVTFRISASTAAGANCAHLVGEFNHWDSNSLPMKRLKNGDFVLTIDLPIGNTYAFRYLLDSVRWCNDEQADAYQASGIGIEQNAIVNV